MAIQEWGSKNAPQENRKLLEITQFPGVKLKEYEEQVAGHLRFDPEADRGMMILDLTNGNEKAAQRMELGLDVLNQLGAVGKTAQDVRSVVVKQDVNSAVQRGDGEQKPRSGEGGHHYWYEIDWIKEPDVKEATPDVSNTQARRDADEHAAFGRRVTRYERTLQEMKRRDKEREAQIIREEEAERIRKERKAIDNVVIDTVTEVGQREIDKGTIKIELGENGAAQIFFKQWQSQPGLLVDRTTGKYHPYEGDSFESATQALTETINPRYLKYFNIAAQQAEGEEVRYFPEPLDLETCEDIFERARKADMIRVGRDHEIGVVFQYLSHSDSILGMLEGFGEYSIMNLEKEVVDARNVFAQRVRPIHPQFAEFLRQKKAQLEKEK